jgi:hypothetical protein
MSDEQQPVDTEIQPEVTTEEPAKAADPAPAEPVKKEVPPLTEDQQEAVNRAIGEKVAKQRKAEREAETLRKRVAELEASPQPKLQPVPALPDPLAVSDAEFRKALAEQQEVVRKNATLEAQVQQANKAAAEAKQELERRQIEEFQKKVSDYKGNSEKLGITAEELQQAGQIVADIGLSNDLVDLILEDEDGPLMTKYLSRNPVLLEELSRMDPVRAAVKLMNAVKPQAAAMKPKPSKAPDPVETPSGGSMTRLRNKYLEGATFE